MLQMFIEPLDTLFFRDSRSFNAGEETVAEFSFPSPLTFFGAIGTAVLENSEESCRAKFLDRNYPNYIHPKLGIFDDKLENTRLKLKGPFLHKKGEIFFPAPANLKIVGEYPYISYFLLPDKEITFKWDISYKSLRPLRFQGLESEKEGSKPIPAGLYIPTDVLSEYLFGQPINLLESEKEIPEYQPILYGRQPINLSGSKKEKEFFLRETHYGNAISKRSRTPKKRCLYTATHLRFVDELEFLNYSKAGFTLFVEGLETEDVSKLINLGGEKRKVNVTCIETLSIPEQLNVFKKENQKTENLIILEKFKETRRFFIYFATPSIFENGWYRELPDEFNDAILVGAAVNKPIFISGWKTGSNKNGGSPRVVKKAVPPGSVYFYEAKFWDDDKFKRFCKKYHFGESLSEVYPAAGFGITFVGSW